MPWPTEPTARLLFRLPTGRTQSLLLIRLQRSDWSGVQVIRRRAVTDTAILESLDEISALTRPLRPFRLSVLASVSDDWLMFLAALPFVVVAALVFGTALGRGCPIPPPEWLR